MVSMSQATSSLFLKNDGNLLFIVSLGPRAARGNWFFLLRGHTLPVGNAMKIAHTSVLCAKASAWTDIARIRRSQFIGKNCFAFGWLNFHLKNINEIFIVSSNFLFMSCAYLSNNIFKRNSGEYLFDCRRQVGHNHIRILFLPEKRKKENDDLFSCSATLSYSSRPLFYLPN